MTDDMVNQPPHGDEDLNKAAWYMERLHTYKERMAEKG